MDTALKQRLIGASVLIALAVIFLPMLIKGPAPESGAADVPLNLPDAPQGEFETVEMPLVTPGASAPAPVTGTPVPAQPATGAALPAAAAAGQYAVGFGSYATAEDAGRVVAALRASQLPGYQEPVPADAGRTLHRVRIGPYVTQAEAEAARLRAAHVSDRVSAKVVVLDAPEAATATAAAAPATSEPAGQPAASQPAVTPATPPAVATTPQARPVATPPAPATKPTAPPAEVAKVAPRTEPAKAEPKPATPPAASNVGFAVQLGAFASADEAARLRDRARAAGFSAFVEQVRTDKGVLNRVRVGPVADRAEADRLRSQVSANLGVAGIVRPHP